MKFTPLSIPDVLIFEPNVYEDQRGFFFESFNQSKFEKTIGRKITFVQDNHSKSKKGVLRGLHYQIQQTQGKLVRVTVGAVYDVAVDMRQSSVTFGKWVGVELSAENKKQLWVPPGFAHGFLVVSDEAEFLYKTTDYYHPASEQVLIWSDESINIQWPQLEIPYSLSERDQAGSSWEKAIKFS